MPTYKTTGHWQQVDRGNGRIVSGETFTCCHCSALVDVVFGEAAMGMCDYERLPLCHACSVKYHSGGQRCSAEATKLAFLDRCRREQEDRAALARSLGIE
jgi:hypothetical protein